ncbi:cytochrome c [candidate division KSB1 bacterium]|nr:cytochrome c [candidate division KSB1 bacterium]
MCRESKTAIIILFITLSVRTGSAQESDSTIVAIYTDDQAERGALVYEKSCGICHQPEQFKGAVFMDAWGGQPVDALYTLIRTTMPYDNPSRLSRRQYAEILAYIFKLNGMPAGETKLPSNIRKLKKITIEPLPEKRSKQ